MNSILRQRVTYTCIFSLSLSLSLSHTHTHTHTHINTECTVDYYYYYYYHHYHHRLLYAGYPYTYSRDSVPRGYIVAAILSFLFMVPLFLVAALALLFFYISTLLLLFTAIEFSLSGSSPSIHQEKIRINIHKRNNTKTQ